MKFNNIIELDFITQDQIFDYFDQKYETLFFTRTDHGLEKVKPLETASGLDFLLNLRKM